MTLDTGAIHIVPPARPKHGFSGIVFVLGAMISMQLAAGLAKVAFASLEPSAVVFMRGAISALVMILIARPRIGRWNRRTWFAVTMLGASMAAMNLIFFQAISLIPIGVAVTIEFVGPLALALVQTRRLGDAVWAVLAAIGVGLIGFHSFTGELNLVGVLLALAAAACWAAYIFTNERIANRLPGLEGLSVALVISALLTAPFGAIPAVTGLSAHPDAWPVVIAVALLSNVLAYALEVFALKRIPSRVFGVLMSLEPVLAAVTGLLLLGERLGMLEIAALVIIIVASVGITLRQRRTPPVTAPIEIV